MNLSDASSKKAGRTTPLHTTDTHLYGRWLVLVQLLCLTLCVLSVGLYVASVLSYIANHYCTGTAAACHPYGPIVVRPIQGPGLDIYTIVRSSIFSLGYWLVAAFLFWRKSDDRMALLAAVSLGTFPIVFNNGFLSTLSSPWWFPAHSMSFLGFLCFSLFFYVFPSGHFVPRWMRWAFAATLIYWGFNTFFPFSSFNPFYTYQVLNNLVGIGQIASIVVVQIYRYQRASSPAQRQQTKWVVYGVSLGWIGYLLLLITRLFFPSLFQASPLVNVIAGTVLYGFVLLVPFFIGFAIVRSRLWEIDVIINRTLVYSTLTGTLALVYIGLVIGLQALLSSIISHNNGVAIVISTLAIAALFQPLRHRLQQVIDRRFYRRKYNVAQTLAAFSTTLRNEVDLDQLREALLAIVQETMQPSYVSLWLRPTAPDRQPQLTRLSTPPAH